MIRKLLFVLIITASIPFQMNAEWVSLNKDNTPNTLPNVTLLSDDDNSTVIKIDISGFDLTEFKADGKTYQSIDLLSDVFSSKVGYPELPYIAKLIAIPDQAGVSIEVMETGEVKTFNNIHIQPARESWFEGKPETPYIENTKAYQSSGVYPQDYVSIDPPAIFRDFRIARISVFPLRYFPATNELQAVSSITVRIKYGSGKVVNPKTSAKKEIAPSFAKLYRSSIFNYQSVLDKQFKGGENGHEVMLCIMPDQYVNTFQDYAEWKHLSGTEVHITKFSDIGANPNNPDIIKDHIADAYHNWEYPPTYVLMIGDDGVFPKKIVSYDYSFPNEDFFVEIDGDDFFPEMMIGRLTNQSDFRLQVMLNKFMKYEKEPYVADTDWFKKGICCSNNYYPSQVRTKRITAEVMMLDGGFTSVDTLMSDGEWGSGCSMNLNDVKNAINDGRSYLNYRGEGWNDGWHANCYSFSASDVSSLNNGEKFTFVTSIGCGVAMFDSNEGNCFGEEWLELGSLSSPRGAVAFVGPTSNTHTTYNNRIDKGIYAGMFQEGMDTPGQALLRGKLYMYNVFGDDSWVEYHYRIYCVLGDPSVHIWKDVPMEISVNNPESVPVGYSQPEFTITFASTGLPVSNAEVCISGDDIFATRFTDTTGKVLIGIEPETAGILSVTVRGGNVIPNLGTMGIVQTGEHVGPSDMPVIIDIDGNTDGLINPNENCMATFTLKNWGTQTANDVEATISVSDPDLAEVVTTSPVSFGNLNSGSSFTGEPFQFHVKIDCPVGQIVTLQLHVTSGSNSWDYQYDVEISGCQLEFMNYLVDDEGANEKNYRMDPGETVDVIITVGNMGTDYAPNVMGYLHSNDPYITIDDSVGTFGTININNAEMSLENKFVVSVDPSCPTEYEAEYSLKLFTQYGSYEYETIRYLIIPVSNPISSDFTGPDTYGYYAYSSEDTLFEQAPVYDWFEISSIGSEISLPNWESDYTETVNIPFEFKYYGIDYDQIRLSSDGWAAFGSGSQTAATNYSLPNNDNINNMIGAFWDDLYNPYWGDDGEVLYYNDNTDHRFIIEWYNIMHQENSYEPKIETFQIILLDPAFHTTQSGNGEIILQYNQVEGPGSCTVGIENETQDIGLQYTFNGDYDATASSLHGSTAIKFTTEPPFVSIPVSVDENAFVTGKYNLGQNYPNPFKTSTTIHYSLPDAGTVSLKVFNVRGELVRILQENEQLAEGKHEVIWNGVNDIGNRVSPGFYFYQLQSDGFVETMKMLILK
jgi:hypothetical protein